MTLDERAIELLDEASHLASTGSASEMEGALLALEWKVQSRTLDTFIEDIRRTGYENAIPILIEHAERMAVEGHSVEMEHDLSQVREYEHALGRDVTGEFAFEQQGYALSVPHELEHATRHAESGRYNLMDYAIERAHRWAQKAGIEIDEADLPDRTAAYTAAYERTLTHLENLAPDTSLIMLAGVQLAIKHLAPLVNAVPPTPPEVVLDIYANAIGKDFGKILSGETEEYRRSVVEGIGEIFDESNNAFAQRWGFYPKPGSTLDEQSMFD